MTAAADPARFSADWLQLREPFDAAARDAAAKRLGLPGRLARWRAEAKRDADRPWRVLDLGCGTGANLRWLAPRLGGPQQWLVADHDAALLRRWPVSLGGGGPTAHPSTSAWQTTVGSGPGPRRLGLRGPGFEADIVRRQIDLAASLECLPWPAIHLVTASALIDLPGAAWLERLADVTASAGAALLMALSVDGRHVWSVADPEDAAVAARFADHQRRDKGFGGPALGPHAAPALAQALRRRGYRVFTARSDWVLGGSLPPEASRPGSGLWRAPPEPVRADAPGLALQRALIDGMASAAAEQAPEAEAAVAAWRHRRQALAVRSVLRVGHLDLLALPPQERRRPSGVSGVERR